MFVFMLLYFIFIFFSTSCCPPLSIHVHVRVRMHPRRYVQKRTNRYHPGQLVLLPGLGIFQYSEFERPDPRFHSKPNQILLSESRVELAVPFFFFDF
ncbi:hypothetical protein BDV26DRAFT_253175 [Aspergillus bertholletiae]|uniref:Secreted protein n=1 Tax=Aspergillus bertholletiae TaxID=1226010 RepID=A0A5N7BL83_9EURO|nr:hypothetical protein BDV26DRAFT_253175 [Aspergillus bertholletiae]